MAIDVEDPTTLQKVLFQATRSGLFDEIGMDLPIRQGKTAGMGWNIVDRTIERLANNITAPSAFLGNTMSSVETNLGEYIDDVAEQYGIACKEVGGRRPHWLLANKVKLYKLGGDTKTAFRRWRGITLGDLGIDENTLVDKTAYDNGKERRSFTWSMVFATCNADRPNHWYRTDYLNEAGTRVDIRRGKVTITKFPEARYQRMCYITGDFWDNHHYPEERRQEMLARDPSSPSYRRNILGEWVADEGAVFPLEKSFFTSEDPAALGIVGYDHGTAGTFAAMLCTPRQGNTAYGNRPNSLIADELYHRRAGVVDDHTKADMLEERWGGRFRTVVLDPATSTNMKAILRMRGYTVIDANNDILRGVDATNNALFSGAMKIHESIRMLRVEADSYVWDEVTQKPKKGFDHLCDILRYLALYLYPPVGSYYG